MPITINMWKHTKEGLAKLTDHAKLGPFFAGISGGNVGHMNVIYETYGSKETLKSLKTKHNTLPFQKVFSHETVKLGEKDEVTEYKRGERIEGGKVENSYWPHVKPSTFEHLQSFVDPKKGVPGEFREHLADMISEDEEERKIIHHEATKAKKTDESIQALKNLSMSTKTNTFTLEKEIKSTSARIEQLKTEKENLQQSGKYKTRIKELDRRISALEDDLGDTQKRLTKEQDQLNEITKRLDLLQFERVEKYRTEGRHPDFSVTLPTKESGKKFFLDDEAMLSEMEKQRVDPKYALFGNNCSLSVKKVIMAGISDEMKQEMLDAGVPKKFFKIKKIEAPGEVLQWTLALSRHMDDLNKKYEAAPSAGR